VRNVGEKLTDSEALNCSRFNVKQYVLIPIDDIFSDAYFQDFLWL